MDFNVTEMKELNAALKKAFGDMEEGIKRVNDVAEKAADEVKREGTLHGETSKKLTELGELGQKCSKAVEEIRDRMTELEQKGAHRPGGGDRIKSVGEIITESDQWKRACELGSAAKGMDPVNVGSFHRKTAIFNATLNNDQPLVQAQRLAGIIVPGEQQPSIRDLLAQGQASSNYIEFVKENVFTNSAAPQGSASSPTDTEGQLKAESGITFTLAGVGVITIAHWIPASRQVLSDAAMLQGYIGNRLMQGLKYEEDDELLNGAGTNGELTGIISGGTAFNRGATHDTQLDSLLKALTQVRLTFFEPDAFVLNPTDWEAIQLLKDSQNRYLFSDPHGVTAPRIWGKPVVTTTRLTAGQFVTGAFKLAAQIWDKEDATVRVAEQHGDFFVRNMVAILCEERLALTIYRAGSMVNGTLGNSN